jgi:hypothetical protein
VQTCKLKLFFSAEDALREMSQSRNHQQKFQVAQPDLSISNLQLRKGTSSEEMTDCPSWG